MKRKKRSSVFILTVLWIFSLLLVACNSSALSLTTNSTARTSRNLTAIDTSTPTDTPATSDTSTPTDTPTASDTSTPTDTPTASGTATTTTTGTPTTNTKGDFVGEIPTMHAWIGLSSNGHRMVAFTTDGFQNHPISFAQWFRGTIQNNSVTATPSNPGITPTPSTTGGTTTPGTGGGGSFMATLTQSAAIGTVTLKDGRSFPFTANAITDPTSQTGLYRSERTINNVHYLAGWILQTNPASSTATPGATVTTTPGIVPTVTVTITPGIVPTVTVTTTPGATALKGGSGIINEQTGALIQAPDLTSKDLAVKQVTVPNLGTFNLRQCRQDQC